MSAQKEAISRQALLKIANQFIKQHGDYLTGMGWGFGGIPCFLDEQGLPTAKTTAVFNMFNHLAVVLSAQYHPG